MRRLLFIVANIIVATLASLAVPALAQSPSWPNKPVRFIVPLGAGAGADLTARLFAERLAVRWGQPVLVENRPGGDSVVAINALLSARDDHVFVFGPSSNLVGHPYTHDKPPYDAAELQPIARVTSTVVAVAVPASLNVDSMKAFLALARERPGQFNWASVTTASDILFAGYFKSAGLNLTQISYRDTVSALNDLVESRIHLYVAAYAIVRAQVQAGRVKVIALTNRVPAPGLDLPSVAGAGYPELNFDGLVGLMAARSSNLPEAAITRIAADIKAVAAEPKILERLHSTAQIVIPGTGAEFTASMDEQASNLAAVAKTLGTKKRY